MKKSDITIGQAKQVLPAWLTFLKTTSTARLADHPAISEMVEVWMKHFAVVLDADFYQSQEEIINGEVKSDLLLDEEKAMDETDLYIKRQKVKEYLETHKLTLVDLGFEEESTLETITEEGLDSFLDDIEDFKNKENERIKRIFHILEVRKIDRKNQCDNYPSLSIFPNKTQFIVGGFSSKEKALEWIKGNPGYHGYDPSEFFYVLLLSEMDSLTPPCAEVAYDLNGNRL